MPTTGIRIHPKRPVADGILFDDLESFGPKERAFLAARGVVFCTQFKANGRTYSGNIIATSWDHAENIAFGRGLDEEVIGVLVRTKAA